MACSAADAADAPAVVMQGPSSQAVAVASAEQSGAQAQQGASVSTGEAGEPEQAASGSMAASSSMIVDDSPATILVPEEVAELDEGACGRVTQLAELTSINLVILFDSSGSMGDSESTGVFNLDKRWTPALAGIRAFFEAPGSPGIHAALKFFPHPGGFDVTCNPDNYGHPDVSLRELNDPSAFVQALEMKKPSGGTPMLPALMGAMDYATKVLEQDPGSKTMVVMITDGEPAVIPEGGMTLDDVDPECPGGFDVQNTVAGVADFVRARYQGEPSIPTYVLGIGSSVSQLGQIALEGGTEMVFIDDADPSQTQSALSAAFESIRSVNFDCEIDFPQLPEGESIGSVNVDFVGSAGGLTELEKVTESCSSVGWRLDDERAPTKIQLCDQACQAVQADPDGELQLAIGCATRVQRVR